MTLSYCSFLHSLYLVPALSKKISCEQNFKPCSLKKSDFNAIKPYGLTGWEWLCIHTHLYIYRVTMIHFLSTAKTRKYWCKELNKLSESHPARVSMEFQPSLGTYCAQIKLCAPVPVGLGLHLHSSHSLHRRRRRPLSASMICASALVISYWISCYRLLFVICYLEIQSFFGHPFLNDLAPWKCISHRHFSLMLLFFLQQGQTQTITPEAPTTIPNPPGNSQFHLPFSVVIVRSRQHFIQLLAPVTGQLPS